MVKRLCDRCGVELPPEYFWSQVQFPIVEITVKRCLYDEKRTVDLCRNCAKAVVDLIFEAEEDPADEGGD